MRAGGTSPDLSSSPPAPFQRSGFFFLPVFAQLEYYYSILSGSARNWGNQLRSSCLTALTWKAQLEPVDYHLLLNRKNGRTWTCLWGEFLGSVHLKLRQQWGGGKKWMNFRSSKSVPGGFFKGGQDWWRPETSSSTKPCFYIYIYQSGMWGQVSHGKTS